MQSCPKVIKLVFMITYMSVEFASVGISKLRQGQLALSSVLNMKIFCIASFVFVLLPTSLRLQVHAHVS